jgi:hypothetical protein
LAQLRSASHDQPPPERIAVLVINHNTSGAGTPAGGAKSLAATEGNPIAMFPVVAIIAVGATLCTDPASEHPEKITAS